MKLTGTNRPTTYTTQNIQNSACVHYVVPNQQPPTPGVDGTEPTTTYNNTTNVVTTVFPPPATPKGFG